MKWNRCAWVLVPLALWASGSCSDESEGGTGAGDTSEDPPIRARDSQSGDGDEAAADAAGDTPASDVRPDTGGVGDVGGTGDGPGAEDQDAPVEDTGGGGPNDLAADTGLGTDTGAGEGVCAAASAVHTGTNVSDFNADPIRIGDRMVVTVEVIGEATAPTEASLHIQTANLDVLGGTVRRNGIPFAGVVHSGPLLEIPLTELAPAEYTFEANVVSDLELIQVLSRIDLVEEGCTLRRSQSGAVLQVLGGEFKIPQCVDMRQFTTLQVAPNIQLQNTSTYRERNGERDDLLAGDFIYCPQHPAIVHVAEFCIINAPGQSITLAGTYDADADWEVDDFMLIEVFEDDTLLDDGFTTQTHPGGDTFWCGEIEELVCTDGCQASLTVLAEDRELEPIDVVSAVGERPRRFDDQAVEVTSLLSSDETPVTIRITCLDVGIEGLLDPQLYLVSEEPL